jgi:hypothetical protein
VVSFSLSNSTRDRCDSVVHDESRYDDVAMHATTTSSVPVFTFIAPSLGDQVRPGDQVPREEFQFELQSVAQGRLSPWRRHPTGRERMGSLTLQTLQDPILPAAMGLLLRWRLLKSPKRLQGAACELLR